MYDIRETIFNLFKSFGYTLKLYDTDGKGPFITALESEYIYARKGNQTYMVVIEDDTSREYDHIVIYKTNSSDPSEFRDILKQLNSAAIKSAYSITVKNFGRQFSPKDFSNLPKEKKATERQRENLEESWHITGKNPLTEKP